MHFAIHINRNYHYYCEKKSTSVIYLLYLSQTSSLSVKYGLS